MLVEGADFYSDPIVSPDGKFLAWLQWNHPNMPWDGTELWVAVINPDGSIGSREKIAGGAEESIFQPEWSPDGALFFVVGSHRLVESLSMAWSCRSSPCIRWRRSSASRSGRSAW